MLLVQIHGSSRYFLSAHTDSSCSYRDCSSQEKSISLNDGEMLVVTNFPDLWHEVSLQKRRLKNSDDSFQLNVVLILFADVNYEF